MNRNREIIKTSVFGVSGNLFLVALKMAVGLVTNSIAITMDAVNNLTDALSSIITIIGTRLSEKDPDRKHPFGYGRIEYLTSLLIGMMILYAGVSAVRHSILRIIHPEAAEYTLRAMILVAIAVVVKVAMGLYTMRKGKELDSTPLVASGHDSLDDSIETAATFLAAIVYIKFNVSIEAYVGLVISILVFKTGIETLRETVSTILGERVDIELASRVKESILSFPEVDGVFDLVIHNYGKEKMVGSAHIEVPDVLTAAWVDNLQRSIKRKVLKDTGIEMLGITIYAENSRDSETMQIREAVYGIAEKNSSITGVYGFYLDKVDKAIKFDVATDFEVKDLRALRKELEAEVGALYPDYEISIDVKRDIAD